jgi:hypothetical protein
MISATLLLLATLLCLTSGLAFSHLTEQRRTRQHLDILSRGQCCRGRLVAVQRPFLFESTTRLYFEFAPPGSERPVQCCHTEKRASRDVANLLPSAGTFVTVRYLPECPEAAVIGSLVGETN